ncbi:MAG TPA: D-alanyl-D-alanine carboxypeptidase/D-alanyl-D-alanine-endopeptidase [Rhodanobacteraceae bacterium]|nr:D-alanyl-D-alanine carboxypeptidase/D-alanyl-D-alanine-endopeptidase [Rhodanobacteraceae bacterium]
MKRLGFALAAAMLLAGCASAPPPKPTPAAHPAPITRPASPVPNAASPRYAPSSLADGIDAYVSQPRFAHAQWGIEVASLDTGRTLYRRNADSLFLPASNAKLYTAALALQTLGPDARFTTALYATAAPRAEGTIAGDLILHGGGDPSLGDPEVSPDWADRLATALANRGVRRVRGDLVADDTWFAGPLHGGGWEAADLQASYGAQSGALGTQDNVVHVKAAREGTRCCTVAIDPPDSGMRVVNLTGGPALLDLYRPPGTDTLYASGSLRADTPRATFTVAAPDGALLAANQLRDALAQHGIALDGKVRVLHWPETDAALASQPTAIAGITSPPLSQLLVHMLKHSDNRYAQMLLQQVGVRTAQAGACADRIEPPQTSADWGLCAMRAFLARIGVDEGEVTLGDGAGLSRHDLVTPAATVKLLGWIMRQPFANVLRNALPVAGIDGTLKYRMRDDYATDNVQAKTGTLSHVYTLSGFVTDAAGERLVFSLMLNRYVRPTDEFGRNIQPSPQSDLDAIATMLAMHGVN